MTKPLTLLLCLFFPALVHAQVSLQTAGDLYYLRSAESKDTAVALAVQHSQANTFTVNHVVVGVSYKDTTHGNFECVVALQGGTYVTKNYSAEPELLRHLYDARVAVDIAPHVRLNAGVFGSGFLGPYSTLSIENPTALFAMASDYSPYYLSGISGTYEKGTVTAMLGVFTGFQHIADNNGSLSPGFSFAWKPRKGYKFGVSGLYGNEALRGDPHKAMSFFVPELEVPLARTVRCIVVGGYGTHGSTSWHTGSCTLEKLARMYSYALRAEYLSDAGVWNIANPIYNATLGLSRKLHSNLSVRIEGRVYSSSDALVPYQKNPLVGMFVQWKV